jgi:SAM-dependent methyltransferase
MDDPRGENDTGRLGIPAFGSDAWHADLDEAEQTGLGVLLEELAAEPFLQQVAARSLALLALQPGERVLEMGCGTGVFLPALTRAVAPDGLVIGIDHADSFLTEARQRVDAAGVGDRVALEVADALQLPFPDGSFDTAHCERVLMHLEDPEAALRELRRVVRPGGRVVVAEPDSAGIRMDHPDDPEAMALIAARDLMGIRQPAMGLELNRHLARVGFVERRIEVLTEFDPTYHPMVAASDRRAAAALVAEGTLTRERAEAAIRYLEEASERGEYAWMGSFVVALGRVPSA